MSYEMVFAYPFHGLPTDEAIERLVGQTPMVNGAPGEVLAAWRDEHDAATVRVRVRAEGEPPDVSGIVGFSVDRAGRRL